MYKNPERYGGYIGICNTMYMIGFVNNDYSVYIGVDDELKTPHFHYVKNNDWGGFNARINLCEPKYIQYDDVHYILDLEKMAELLDFLNSHWTYIVSQWNLNNDVKVDQNLRMPNYNELEVIDPESYDDLYSEPERYSDGSTKDYTELSMIGFTNDGYGVFINAHDEYKTPHFHYAKKDDWESFHTCIKIETPEYLYHVDDQGILNSNQKKNLINLLQSYEDHYETKWKYLLSRWNGDNYNVEPKLNTDLKMPDYSLL